MCESAGMILIYTPKYESHPFTRREHAAMQLIEDERRQWYCLPSHLIIPVIMTRHPVSCRRRSPARACTSTFRAHHGDRGPEDQSRLIPAIEGSWSASSSTTIAEALDALPGTIAAVSCFPTSTGMAQHPFFLLPKLIRCPWNSSLFPAAADRARQTHHLLRLRGGRCRNVALTTIAVLLAERDGAGVPALMIDWDPEAPGLHDDGGAGWRAGVPSSRPHPGLACSNISKRAAITWRYWRAAAADADAVSWRARCSKPSTGNPSSNGSTPAAPCT